MANSKNLMQAAAGNAGESVYVEDVFSTYLYEGNDSNGSTEQEIVNGLDLSTEGGMVWMKSRDGARAHCLYDTERGNGYFLDSSTTAAQIQNTTSPVWRPTTTGFFTGRDYGGSENQNGESICSWSFRKQAGFFDVVTYTGTGSNQTISHNLGSVPGCIIVRSLSGDNWYVWHRSLPTGALDSSTGHKRLILNSTAAEATSNGINTVTSTSFDVLGSDGETGGSSTDYVAYVFAHDDQSFGDNLDQAIIKCGTFNLPSYTDVSVSVGFEPQWVLVKNVSTADDWRLIDVMRGAPMKGSNSAVLRPNLSNAEADNIANQMQPQPDGFIWTGSSGWGYTGDHIYIAIRRPMKAPTAGTEVYAPIARSGNSTNNTEIAGGGFPLDWVVTQGRNAAIEPISYTRLQSHNKKLLTYSNAAEASSSTSVLKAFLQDGFKVGTDTDINNSSYTYIYWFFKRAAKFMDIVAYTGTGASRALSHNLNAAPELAIFKLRSTTDNWMVASTATTATMFLNTTGSESSSNYSDRFTSFTDTAINFSGVSSSYVNENNKTYIAWLFATLPGVSKCGTYTGTGAAQNIDCGFSGTARFILIKSRDNARGWFVYDSARGIVAGNDPYQLWNAAGSETTSTDYIDPYAGGFALSGSNDLNVSSEKYLFLAIA